MPDLRPTYVFGPWVTPSDRPHFAYRAAPREDDRAEVWLYRSEDGTASYWCGCWGGMTDSVELRDARDIGEAQARIDALIVGSGHYLYEALALRFADQNPVEDRVVSDVGLTAGTIQGIARRPILARLIFFALILGGINLLAVALKPFDPTLAGWTAAVFGFWVVDMLMSAYRHAKLVSGIVRSLTSSTTYDPFRWRGSKIRIWLALFVIGRAANKHGQSAEIDP